jgi:hypothetical protein
VELINGLTEDECENLFKKMQAMVPKDKRGYPRGCDSVETSEERRSGPRVDFQCPVYIEGVPGQKTITNLSAGGAFIQWEAASRSTFSTGELIRLTIQLAPEDDTIHVQAQIVNFSDHGMHCHFAHLDRRTAKAIDHWLHAA